MTPQLWMCTIGELNRSTWFEAANFTEAKALALRWLYEMKGGTVKANLSWLPVSDEPERRTIAVILPWKEGRVLRFQWLRMRFGLPLSKWWTVPVEALMSLSIMHDELNEAQRIDLCRKVGLYADQIS